MNNPDNKHTDMGNGAATATFSALNDSFLRMLEHNRAIFEKMMLAMHEESLRFVNLRMEHTSKALQNSRDCQGLTGLITVQHDWLVDAARDYAEESKRFSDVMRDIAAERASEFADVAAQATHNVGERLAA
ncbi:MAG TPA: hypothetical protein VMF58_04140 [Rhizomicrobium sp.]|nr:hypothetical protein [Rhizomicrobium sp.]